MLTVFIPETYEAERRYVATVLISEFLGLELEIVPEDRSDTLIGCDGEGELLIGDGLFRTGDIDWMANASLPKAPLAEWDLTSTELQIGFGIDSVPVLFGDHPEGPGFFRVNDREIYLGLDIFGAAFFMLTRYEETVVKARDAHHRFPAVASLAHREGLLHRPIVNEYLEILWTLMKRLWPRLERQKRNFRALISHDVDSPFGLKYESLMRVARRMGGETIKRLNPSRAIRHFLNWRSVNKRGVGADPENTFAYIMNLSEERGLRSAFYFMPDRVCAEFDSDYSMDDPDIQELMRTIHERGHEFGLHGSYESYNNPEQTAREFNTLIQVCEALRIDQSVWGGRQHYLRWEVPQTWQNWEEAGLNYDSTLSFADYAGFRSGVCFEYSVFNLETRETLSLRERPLILMDCTLMDEKYMGLGSGEKAKKIGRQLKDCCRRYNGDFTMLWHNNRLVLNEERELYEYLLDA